MVDGVSFEASNILMPVYSVAVLCVLVAALSLSFHRLNYPCSKLSECILWVLSWYHVVHSVFLVLISVFHRRHPTSQALNKGTALTVWALNKTTALTAQALNEGKALATQTLNKGPALTGHALDERSALTAKGLNKRIALRQPRSRGGPAAFVRPFLYFGLIFLTKTAVIRATRLRDPDMAAVVAFYSVAVSVPVVLEALIIMFFSVAENAFKVLEESVESLLVLRAQEKAVSKEELERLADVHWSVCDYVDTINSTFGLDIIICMTFNMARFVVFVYLTFVNLYALKLTFFLSVENGVGLMLELFDVAFRVFYMCYKATEIQRPVIQLLEQVKERKIKIIACNFLEINLSFIEGLVATAFTYLLIFVQYNTKIKARIISDSKNSTATGVANRTSA